MATTDTTVSKRPGFWKRQFAAEFTWGQRSFDGIVGVAVPLACLILDPIVFTGSRLGFLPSLFPQAREEHHGAIAAHFEAAGDERGAFQYNLSAAASARALFANDRAIQYYRHALNLGATAGADELAALHEALADTLTLAGEYPAAHEHFLLAQETAPALSRVWRAQIQRRISETFIPRHLLAQAFAALDQAEAILGLTQADGSLEERREWIQIHLQRSQLLY